MGKTVMPTLEGIPVSPGYAAGTAIVYAYEIERRLKVPHHSVTRSEIGTECARLDDAVEQSNRELKRAEQSARSEPGRADSADLLAAHSLLVDDVAAKVKQRMGRDLVNVEQVLDDVINEIVERLCQLDNAYLRERQQDIRDVGHRILKCAARASRADRSLARMRRAISIALIWQMLGVAPRLSFVTLLYYKDRREAARAARVKDIGFIQSVSNRGRCALAGLGCAALVFCWQWLTVHSNYQARWNALFRTGAELHQPPEPGRRTHLPFSR